MESACNKNANKRSKKTEHSFKVKKVRIQLVQCLENTNKSFKPWKAHVIEMQTRVHKR